MWTAVQTAEFLRQIRGDRLYAAYHLTALRQHRARQDAERAAAGRHYHDAGYVFTGILGDPIKPYRLTHTFQRLAERAGLPRSGCMICGTGRRRWPWLPGWS